MAGNNVEIQLPDGVQLALPEWMLDEQACQEIEKRERPCIAISALKHLRRLLNAQPLLQRACGSTPWSILPQQEKHEQIQATATDSVSGGRSGTDFVVGAAGEMQGTSQSDASTGRANERAEKRRGAE
jgi:hypothetical protein